MGVGARTSVGKISQGKIGFVPYAADYRQDAGCHRTRHTLIVESPQLFDGAAPARQHNQRQRLHTQMPGIEQFNGGHNLRRSLCTLHRGGAQHLDRRKTGCQSAQHIAGPQPAAK